MLCPLWYGQAYSCPGASFNDLMALSQIFNSVSQASPREKRNNYIFRYWTILLLLCSCCFLKSCDNTHAAFYWAKNVTFFSKYFFRKEEGSNRKPILLFDGRHVPTGFRASTWKKIFDGELLDTTIQSFLTVANDLSEHFHEY